MLPLSDPDIRRQSTPVVTWTIIAACSAVFLYQLTLGQLDQIAFSFQFGFIPAELLTGDEFTVLDLGRRTIDVTSPIPTWATAFSAMFLHGGFLHILGNMLFLWVFGDNIEDRMGHVKYLVFYLLCGIAAMAAQMAINPASEIPNIGASGAIAGVLGAYLVLFPHSRINTLVFIVFLMSVVRIPAFFLLGFWFVMQFFSGVGSINPAVDQGGVAYWAHVGGFVAGLAIAALFRPLLVRRRRVRDTWAPPGWNS